MAPKSCYIVGLLLLFQLFFLGCEGDIASISEDEYGPVEDAAVAVSVEWPDEAGTAEDCDAAGIVDEEDPSGARMSAAPVTLSDNCASRDVDKVRIGVQNSSGATLKAEVFDCSAGQGTLSGIEPQSNCTIVVTGLDYSGVLSYEGKKAGVALHQGMNNVGTILVDKKSFDVYTNSIGMKFNYIEPGAFMMGSPEEELGRSSNETQHQVTLTQGYYMQTTEVTQGQWKAVMNAVMRGNPSHFYDCGDACPVENVSWNDAQHFIDELNTMGEETYRLPTEAEWEYAARAGSTTAFANGDITESGSGYDPVLDSMGWYTYNSNSSTHPVAEKDPNAWGLYDMHGNVREWVADWYGDYPASAVTDPTGPVSGTYRVMRGGSWSSLSRSSRSADWTSYDPGFRKNYFGFRLVLLPGH